MARARIGKLPTAEEIADEYRRINRKARQGDMDIQTEKGLAWMLKQLSGIIAESEIEKRLEILEAEYDEAV